MRAPIPFQPTAAGDIKPLSQLFGIPQRVIRIWQLEGYLSRTSITEEQWHLLNMIRAVVWDNRTVLRAMLADLPRAERRILADVAEKTGIERIVYIDMLRFKLRGSGIMGDGLPVTYERYRGYLRWRHPNLWHLLNRAIFVRQRKAALAKISYADKTGKQDQLIKDMKLL